MRRILYEVGDEAHDATSTKDELEAPDLGPSDSLEGNGGETRGVRTGAKIPSLISELLFLLERSWGSHQIQILHRVCLKNFCFFPPRRAPFDVIKIRKETKVLQTNPMQNLNLV